jgi:hypothetical protein
LVWSRGEETVGRIGWVGSSRFKKQLRLSPHPQGWNGRSSGHGNGHGLGERQAPTARKRRKRERTWGQGKPQPQQEELQANKELNKMMMEKQRMNGGGANVLVLIKLVPVPAKKDSIRFGSARDNHTSGGAHATSTAAQERRGVGDFAWSRAEQGSAA